jgi:hypothetical protein
MMREMMTEVFTESVEDAQYLMRMNRAAAT